MKLVMLALSVIVTLLTAPAGFPCTTFVLKDDGQILFGRNLDWECEVGWIIANPRGLRKTALVDAGHPAAQWTSKYGSLTFNQFGWEGPFGGMNEAGLVVEELTLRESSYPTPDARPEIDMLQWIQYQLDNCSTIAEVISTDAKVRQPEPTLPIRIHYLVCDARGDCVTIEFLHGKMVVHHGQALPYSALANSNYAESADDARKNPLPKDFTGLLKNKGSLQRFACAASRACDFKRRTPEQDVACAFEILDQVRLGSTMWQIVYDIPMWQIVYDIPARAIHYRTASNPQRRTLRLSSFDFARTRTVQYSDIQASFSVDGNPGFAELTEAHHREYLQDLFGQESLKQRLGDIAPSIDSILVRLRTYTFVEPPR